MSEPNFWPGDRVVLTLLGEEGVVQGYEKAFLVVFPNGEHFVQLWAPDLCAPAEERR